MRKEIFPKPQKKQKKKKKFGRKKKSYKLFDNLENKYKKNISS